jgi:HEAT repeat protein
VWNGLAKLKAVPADEVILAGLAESDARARGAAVAALIEMGSGEAPPANLLERLNAASTDQRGAVRAAALEALNGIGKGANIAAVKRGLADKDEQVFRQAVRGLVIAWPAAPLPGKLDERFWAAMQDILADCWMGHRDELSNHLAAKVLPGIGEPALPMLTGIFADEDNFDVPLHHRVSEALAAMWPKSKPAIPAYRKAVEKMDGNGDWRFLRRGFGAVVAGDADTDNEGEPDE